MGINNVGITCISYSYFYFVAVTLNNAANIGFLIQARNRSATFMANSDIWGEWLPDPLGEGGTPHYKPLECGRNMDNPLPVFPVSMQFCKHHSYVCNAYSIALMEYSCRIQLHMPTCLIMIYTLYTGELPAFPWNH